MAIIWQILAYGVLVALVLLLLLAIIEPGPLQHPRTTGRRSRSGGGDTGRERAPTNRPGDGQAQASAQDGQPTS